MRHAALAILLCASPLFAVQRTFVASYGLDTNPCTHDQPCRAFTAALAVTSAGGEVVALDSAGYGTATIAQSVTIAAAPGIHAGVSVPSGSGITINGAATDKVALRNLYINGTGGSNGIELTAAGTLHVEHCVVTGFSNANIHIAANGANVTIEDSTIRQGDLIGIWAITAANLILTKSRVDGFANTGIRTTDGTLLIQNCTIANTINGLVVGGSGIAHADIVSTAFTRNSNGVWPFTGGVITIRDSVIAEGGTAVKVSVQGSTATAEVHIQNSTLANNTSSGVYVSGDSGSTNIATVSNCLVTGNLDGVFLGEGPSNGTNRVYLTANTISRNGLGVGVNSGATCYTANDNVIEGNISADVSGVALTSFTKK
jgi:hypothetical protein